MTAEMVLVPAGRLPIAPDWAAAGHLIDPVRVSPFLIDRHAVTRRAYARFVDAGGYAETSFWTPAGWAFIAEHEITEPASGAALLSRDPDEPVTGVSWWEALAYARYVGKTLPTEAQWERAWHGLELDPGDPDAGPRDRPCSAGDLAEWCLDSYSPGAGFAHGPTSDPVCLDDDDTAERVVRGVGWPGRDGLAPWSRDRRIGFRCAYKTAPHVVGDRRERPA